MVRRAIFVSTPEEGRVVEQPTEAKIVRLELKYCEGCGGLLLRRSGTPVVYCGSCANVLREMPIPGRCGSRSRECSPKQDEGRCGGSAPFMSDSSLNAEAVTKKGPKSVRIEASEERRLG